MKFLNFILAKIVIFFIKIYQFTLSPDKWLPSLWLKGKICVHKPHCSKYSIQVLNRFGFYPWIFKVMERVWSCHPWNPNTYDPSHYKIVFLSSAAIWVNFLKELYENKNYEIVWVVTQEDKAVWRWMKIKENIIKKEAKKLWVENIFTPNKINPQKSKEWQDFYNKIKELEPDFLVVIAYGKIIPIDILNIPKKWAINIHWSILPKYRGASPIQSVLLNNEKETGITIMKMNEWMDTWNIIKIMKFDIEFDWNALDIINKMQNDWPKFFSEYLYKYWKWELIEQEQNDKEAIYCKKIQKEDWHIEPWKDSLREIYNKYRWYYLWPKIFFIHNWKRFIIENLKIDKTLFEKNKMESLISNNNELNESIKEIWIKPEGKKTISYNEFKANYL